MRLAYADPPYLGRCGWYGHDHRDGCWDEPTTHQRLYRRLEDEFDGWAWSMSSPSLLAFALFLGDNFKAGEVRVAAWVKPFVTYKANVRVAYAWEPVLFRPGRDSSKQGAPVTRDFLAEPMALQRGLKGAKPARFCRWVLDLLGYVDGDELVDLFPGTGVFSAVAAQGRLVT